MNMEQIERIIALQTILQQVLFAYYISPDNVIDVENVDQIAELASNIETAIIPIG